MIICFQLSRENNSRNLQYIGYIGMVSAVGYGHSQLQYVEYYILTPKLLHATIHLDQLQSLQHNPGAITWNNVAAVDLRAATKLGRKLLPKTVCLM